MPDDEIGFLLEPTEEVTVTLPAGHWLHLASMVMGLEEMLIFLGAEPEVLDNFRKSVYRAASTHPAAVVEP